jgi:hypothetical protein
MLSSFLLRVLKFVSSRAVIVGVGAPAHGVKKVQ